MPDHLRLALANWTRHHLGTEPDGPDLGGGLIAVGRNDPSDRVDRLADVFLHARVAPPAHGGGSLVDDVAGMISDGRPYWKDYPEDEDFLEIVDMHLQRCGGGAAELAALLEDGGSVFTVSGNPPQLHDRVSDEQQSQFDAAVAPLDEASDLLSRAWAKIYGRHRDPTVAWGDAIKAVEVLLAPIVAPKDSTPQLGKMIGFIAQAPRKWTTTLQQEKVAVLDVFVDMLRALYRNPGRHNADIATQAEAEAAVGLSVLIVAWIRTGAFRRADSSPRAVSP